MKRTTLVIAAFIAAGWPCYGADDPPELERLRDTFNQRKASVLEPLEKRYVRDLERLERQYTNRRDDESAEAVRRELYRVLSPKSEAPLQTITLHAKQAKLRGHVRYQKEFNCLGYWSSLGDEIKWEIGTIPPGVYEVSILYSVAPNNGGQYILKMGGRKLKGIAESTGDWLRYETMRVGRIDVEPGAEELVLKGTRKPGTYLMNVRTVTLRPLYSQ